MHGLEQNSCALIQTLPELSSYPELVLPCDCHVLKGRLVETCVEDSLLLLTPTDGALLFKLCCPVPCCPAVSSHTLPCPAHSCPALCCASLPCPALSCFALPFPAVSCFALGFPALPFPALSCFALGFPALPFPVPALLCLVMSCAVLPLPNLAGVG